jgi:hypothetical protein
VRRVLFPSLHSLLFILVSSLVLLLPHNQSLRLASTSNYRCVFLTTPHPPLSTPVGGVLAALYLVYTAGQAVLYVAAPAAVLAVFYTADPFSLKVRHPALHRGFCRYPWIPSSRLDLRSFHFSLKKSSFSRNHSLLLCQRSRLSDAGGGGWPPHLLLPAPSVLPVHHLQAVGLGDLVIFLMFGPMLAAGVSLATVHGARFSTEIHTRACHWFPRLKRACACHSSRVVTPLTGWHCKLRPNALKATGAAAAGALLDTIGDANRCHSACKQCTVFSVTNAVPLATSANRCRPRCKTIHGARNQNRANFMHRGFSFCYLGVGLVACGFASTLGFS